MVEVFKTNVQQVYEADTLVHELLRYFPDARINFDLEDCDKILRIEGLNFPADKVMELVEQNGFNCHLLE